MRASRLLSILLLLQARGRMTAQELADELEVSLRTVYRDVQSLSLAGVPVYGDRGTAGGYRLLDGYRTRLTGLNGDEAESLFLAGMPGAAAELGLGTVLAAAQIKLLAALPPELRSRAGRIRERFHLDAPGWFQDADRTPHLPVVADAVWNQRRLRVRYRSASGEAVRTLEPLGLVLKAGVWYVVACGSDQMRTYRVSRVLEVQTLDERFERPQGFDLADSWRARLRRFEAAAYSAEAVVRLAPGALDRLRRLFSPARARAVLESAGPAGEDGWSRVVVPIVDIDEAVANLLRLGPDAEVVAPPELRRRMAETAAALAAVYRDGPLSKAGRPDRPEEGAQSGPAGTTPVPTRRNDRMRQRRSHRAGGEGRP